MYEGGGGGVYRVTCLFIVPTQTDETTHNNHVRSLTIQIYLIICTIWYEPQ